MSNGKYVYELCVIDSKDDLPIREIIGIFTEEELEPLKLMVEANAMDMNEGCYDFVYIDKIILNKTVFEDQVACLSINSNPDFRL